MQILKNEIGKNTYTFVCETWETSRAWGHRVTMFRNDYEYTTNKVRYYNRTWEMYRYQTCICGAISKVIEEEKQLIVSRYKNANNVGRLSQAKKEELYKESEILAELEELYETRKLRN